MLKSRLGVLVSVGALAWFTACGGAKTTAPDQPVISTATPATACGDIYDAFDAYSSCVGPLLPLAAARDRFIQFCELAAGSTGATGTADAIEQCAAAIKAATPSCGPLDAVCPMPMGSLTVGAPCGVSMQCASGYCRNGLGRPQTAPTLIDFINNPPLDCGVCADKTQIGQTCGLPDTSPCIDGADCGPSPAGPMGVCVARERSDLGGPCGGQPGSAPCMSGLQCAPATSTCAPPPDMGALCTGVCKNGLVCNGANSVASGTCVKGKERGEACNGGPCAGSLLCDPVSTTCVRMTFVGPGAACNLATQCSVGSCQGLGQGTGVCPPVTIDGNACDGSMLCEPYASCGSAPSMDFPEAGPGMAASPDASSPSPEDAGTVALCTLFDPSSCR